MVKHRGVLKHLSHRIGSGCHAEKGGGFVSQDLWFCILFQILCQTAHEEALERSMDNKGAIVQSYTNYWKSTADRNSTGIPRTPGTRCSLPPQSLGSELRCCRIRNAAFLGRRAERGRVKRGISPDASTGIPRLKPFSGSKRQQARWKARKLQGYWSSLVVELNHIHILRVGWISRWSCECWVYPWQHGSWTRHQSH